MNKENIQLESFDIPEKYKEGYGQETLYQFNEFIESIMLDRD
ncbi:MAG: hypothetical protein ACTHVS_05995 [Senegalia sp. (in: firmicutes)]